MTNDDVRGPIIRAAISDADIVILCLIADGLALAAMARRLGISQRTVQRRIRSICNEIGVDAPVQAVVWAVREGIL